MAGIINVLEYYSQCNRYINIDMLGIIKKNNIFNKTLAGYFRSINDILFHILDVDLSWTNDLKKIVKSDIFEDELYKKFDESVGIINPYKTIISFEHDRFILDNLLIKFIKEIDKNDFEKIVDIGNGKNKSVLEILTHTFNHQTHHRGQISQILDENGIENDFSNMIRYDIKSFK
jgi:uncharacterized damage-inducible protein DinB